MLILWQDRAEAEAHAVAAVSAAVVLEEALVAVEDSAADLLAVLTVAASAAHIMVAHLEVTMADISEDTIITITAHSFGDPDDVYMSAAVSAVVVLLLLL